MVDDNKYIIQVVLDSDDAEADLSKLQGSIGKLTATVGKADAPFNALESAIKDLAEADIAKGIEKDIKKLVEEFKSGATGAKELQGNIKALAETAGIASKDSKALAATVEKVGDELDKAGAEAKKTDSSFEKLQSNFSNFQASIITLNQGIQLLQTGLRTIEGLATSLFTALDRAGEVESLNAAFVNLQNSIGRDAPTALRELQNATEGLIRDTDLLRAANQAVVLGVDDGIGKFDDLAGAALRLGRAVGAGPLESINSLVVGIGRQSIAILDNLGVIVKAETAYKSFAAANNKTVEALTGLERRQAFQAAAFAKITEEADKLPKSLDTASVAAQRTTAQLGNLVDRLVVAISENSNLTLALDELSKAFQSVDVESLGRAIGEVSAIFIAFSKNAIQFLLEELGKVADGIRVTVAALEQIKSGNLSNPFQTAIDGIVEYEGKVQSTTNLVRGFLEVQKGLGDGEAAIKKATEALKAQEDQLVSNQEELLKLQKQLAEQQNIIPQTQGQGTERREAINALSSQIENLQTNIADGKATIQGYNDALKAVGTTAKKTSTDISEASSESKKATFDFRAALDSALGIDPKVLEPFKEELEALDALFLAGIKSVEEYRDAIETLGSGKSVTIQKALVKSSQETEKAFEEVVKASKEITKEFTKVDEALVEILGNVDLTTASAKDLQKEIAKVADSSGLSNKEIAELSKGLVDASKRATELRAALEKELGELALDFTADLTAAFKEGFDRDNISAAISSALQAGLQIEGADDFIELGLGLDAGIFAAASGQVVQGLSRVGKSTEETFAGVGQAAGAVLGAAAAAALGAKVGSTFGPIGLAIGALLGAVAGEFFGEELGRALGQNDPGANARAGFKKFIEKASKDISIPVEFEIPEGRDAFDPLRDEFGQFITDESGRIITAVDQAIADAGIGEDLLAEFIGLGIALEGIFEDLDEDLVGNLGQQIGQLLALNFGSPEGLNAIQLILAGAGVSAEELGEKLEEAFLRGNISAQEFLVAQNSLNNIAEQGVPLLEGAEAIASAFATFKDETLSSPLAGLDALQDIAVEASRAGIESFDELRQILIDAGFSVEEITQLFDQLGAQGINTVDELAQIDATQLAQLIDALEKQGFAFADATDEVREYRAVVEGIPKTVETEVTVTIPNIAELREAERIFDKLNGSGSGGRDFNGPG